MISIRILQTPQNIEKLAARGPEVITRISKPRSPRLMIQVQSKKINRGRDDSRDVPERRAEHFRDGARGARRSARHEDRRVCGRGRPEDDEADEFALRGHRGLRRRAARRHLAQLSDIAFHQKGARVIHGHESGVRLECDASGAQGAPVYVSVDSRDAGADHRGTLRRIDGDCQ